MEKIQKTHYLNYVRKRVSVLQLSVAQVLVLKNQQIQN